MSTSSFALFRADILLVVHTPSSREYELVTNMSNEVDLNDEIMEHSFTLIFEMSCVYNLPKKNRNHFSHFKCNCKSHNLNTRYMKLITRAEMILLFSAAN